MVYGDVMEYACAVCIFCVSCVCVSSVLFLYMSNPLNSTQLCMISCSTHGLLQPPEENKTGNSPCWFDRRKRCSALVLNVFVRPPRLARGKG